MSLDTAIQMIVQELLTDEYLDIAYAIAYFGDGKDEHESFMFGFASAHKPIASFDEYVRFIRSFKAQMSQQGFPIRETVDMRASYDRYVEWKEKGLERTPIDASQAERFEALIDKYDDGWSGPIYGLVCREIQMYLRKELLLI